MTTSDTGTVAASDITDLDGETSGVVTVQAGITTLTGTIAQVQAAFDAMMLAQLLGWMIPKR